MGYATGPYSAHSSLPVPARPVLYSARKIKASTKRYELDSTTYGNAQMNSTAQRVLIAVSLADIPQKFISDQESEEARKRILANLATLTDGPAPAIKVLEVSVAHDSTGTVKRRIKFRDLTTGLDQEVQT